MKKNLNKILINIFLACVTIFLLWYIISTENLFGERKETKNNQKKDIVEITFNEKNYNLSYTNFDTSLVENIALFDNEDEWTGGGFYDTDIFMEYPSSLNLAGGGRNLISISKDVNINLEKILNFDLVLNFRSDSNELENSSLAFVDTNGRTSTFILPRLNKGWDAIIIPKEQFDAVSKFEWWSIRKVKFDFLPRPNSKVVVNLAGLRAQPGSLIYNDWNLSDKKMLVLDERNRSVNLLARNIGSTVATLKKITSVSNFTFQSSFTPLNIGMTGLFFRGNFQDGKGYYLMMGGVNSSKWQVVKYGSEGYKILASGDIANFQFKQNEKYYIRVEAVGNVIKSFLSTNGDDYTQLSKLNDDEFRSGGVGVAVDNAGTALFNDFIVKQ